MIQSDPPHPSFPFPEFPWAAMRLLPRFNISFTPVSLPDQPGVFEDFQRLVAAGCVEIRCLLSADNPALGERLEAELRFCGCPCDPFTTTGKQQMAWYALNHAGWVDADGAVISTSEIAFDFSVRITERGRLIMQNLQQIKSASTQDDKLSIIEGMSLTLVPHTATEPQILSCQKLPGILKPSVPAEPEATVSDVGGKSPEAGQPFLITLCSGTGRDASYIDRENITAGTGVSMRTIASYDQLAKNGSAPCRNDVIWAGVAVMAYASSNKGTISKRQIALYDMHMVRSFFGKVDTTKIRPRNVFLVPEKRP